MNANIINRKKELINEAARKASMNIILKGKEWDRRAKSDNKCRRKYQAGLTIDEAATIEAIRSHVCPQYSRYAFVRLLLLNFIETATEAIENYERSCSYE